MSQMTTPRAEHEAATPVSLERPQRLLCLDAYRGLAMLAMAMGPALLAAFIRQRGGAWRYQLEHTVWSGCSIEDLIQPSFMFMVGVAMPFSYAARRARGQSRLRVV